MTNLSVALPAIDVIDDAVSLAPGQPTWTLRRQRDKVVAATQSSHDAMFSHAVEGLTRTERLLVALHACRVSHAPTLAAHYREDFDHHFANLKAYSEPELFGDEWVPAPPPGERS